jgi:predicted nuclease of predicted toxin-antitoxin system
VRLLFDHNLSHRLVPALGDVYPGSAHVRTVGLERAPDGEVWNDARSHGFAIASKDSDFHQRSLVEGFPPKVIWVQRGNCSTPEIDALLRQRSPEISAFGADRDAAFLELD